MARRYKMTPKRKAALRKAQAASARKRHVKRRRNRRLYVAGGVTVLAATAAAGYVGHRYVKSLRGGPQRPNVVSVTTAATPAPVGPQMSAADKAQVVAQKVENLEAREEARRKKAVKREISSSKKGRRESRKRSKYWLGKKIPKRNRFTRRNYFG